MKKVVNPFCTCNPCKCDPICTCGLRLVSREEDVRWDSETQTMKVEYTEKYERDVPK